MANNFHIYSLEAVGDRQIWENMHIYLQLFLVDENDVQIGMLSANNIEDRLSGQMAVNNKDKPAAGIKIGFYAIPQVMPDSRSVVDNPPLSFTIRVLRDGEVIDTIHRKVNPWGGDQLIGISYL